MDLTGKMTAIPDLSLIYSRGPKNTLSFHNESLAYLTAPKCTMRFFDFQGRLVTPSNKLNSSLELALTFGLSKQKKWSSSGYYQQAGKKLNSQGGPHAL